MGGLHDSALISDHRKYGPESRHNVCVRSPEGGSSPTSESEYYAVSHSNDAGPVATCIYTYGCLLTVFLPSFVKSLRFMPLNFSGGVKEKKLQLMLET